MKSFFLALFGALIGTISTLMLGVTSNIAPEPEEKIQKNIESSDYISEYYKIENAVMVSPHGLRKSIDEGKNNFTLVDLRSAEEYEKSHIKGAINIPAYRDKDHNAYDQTERIISSFEALPKDKEIIVYCYSRACMTGRKVGKMLADANIYVKHLGIGWNEWRYDWKGWNHEHEWSITSPDMYIEGSDSGFTGSTSTGEIYDFSPCTTDGLTGC